MTAHAPDRGRLGTDQLGQFYVDLLRQGGSLQDLPIQSAWPAGSKAERLAALRLVRERTREALAMQVAP